MKVVEGYQTIGHTALETCFLVRLSVYIVKIYSLNPTVLV